MSNPNYLPPSSTQGKVQFRVQRDVNDQAIKEEIDVELPNKPPNEVPVFPGYTQETHPGILPWNPDIIMDDWYKPCFFWLPGTSPSQNGDIIPYSPYLGPMPKPTLVVPLTDPFTAGLCGEKICPIYVSKSCIRCEACKKDPLSLECGADGDPLLPGTIDLDHPYVPPNGVIDPEEQELIDTLCKTCVKIFYHEGNWWFYTEEYKLWYFRGKWFNKVPPGHDCLNHLTEYQLIPYVPGLGVPVHDPPSYPGTEYCKMFKECIDKIKNPLALPSDLNEEEKQNILEYCICNLYNGLYPQDMEYPFQDLDNDPCPLWEDEVDGRCPYKPWIDNPYQGKPWPKEDWQGVNIPEELCINYGRKTTIKRRYKPTMTDLDNNIRMVKIILNNEETCIPILCDNNVDGYNFCE